MDMGNRTVELVLCLALVGSAALAQGPQSGNSVAIQPGARQILLLANQARAAKRMQPLKWDQALANAAVQHCIRMAAEGPIAHRYGGEPSLTDRAAQAGARFSLIEENVAIGPTPEAIHEEWMQSEGHRANILNPEVDRVGVALMAKRGVLYAVADYAQGVPVLTRSEVEARIADLIRVSGVAIGRDPTAARAACTRDQGVPDGSSDQQVRFVMRWQGADLTRLPQKLVDQLASGNYRRAAVGSCAARETAGDFTAYRVAVLLY
jgi:hypothetical protein